MVAPCIPDKPTHSSGLTLRVLGLLALRGILITPAMVLLGALSFVGMEGVGDLSIPLAAIALLGLAVLIQWPRVTVGWILAATFGLALVCALSAPDASRGALRHFWQAESAFAGAAIGAVVGTACVLGASRFRFDVRLLLELALASSLVMALYQAYEDARVRNERWSQSIQRTMDEGSNLSASLPVGRGGQDGAVNGG